MPLIAPQLLDSTDTVRSLGGGHACHNVHHGPVAPVTLAVLLTRGTVVTCGLLPLTLCGKNLKTRLEIGDVSIGANTATSRAACGVSRDDAGHRPGQLELRFPLQSRVKDVELSTLQLLSDRQRLQSNPRIAKHFAMARGLLLSRVAETEKMSMT